MQNMAQMGRFGDTSMAHVSPGEMVVPKEILNRRPNLQRGIMGAIAQEGMDPRRYTVGASQNSINPMTGQPEYFNLKKLLKFAAPFLLGPAVGSAIGSLFPSLAGAGALASTARGALGAAGTSALTGGKKKDILRSALMGGLGGYTFDKTGAADKGKGFFSNEGRTLDPIADKKLNFATSGIKTMFPDSSFVNSKAFDLLNNPLGLAATLGLTAEAFAAMSPEEKEEAVRAKFGSTDRYNALVPYNKGGVASFPRRNGGIMPSEGSGTKDDVPAMLTAGEFVLTRDAVKGLGNGNLDSGIQKAYGMMDKLERMA
mgnify:CR=1 FL=1|tara:strand:+ start:120 stop:1061 length:942 start_codon:yes stop_codon:yes gene_type:complete